MFFNLKPQVIIINYRSKLNALTPSSLRLWAVN